MPLFGATKKDAQNYFAPDRWERDVSLLIGDGCDKFRTRDLVFYGSSTLRLWPEKRLPIGGRRLSNLSFGGATMFDLATHSEKLFLNTFANDIVIYGGDNDIGNYNIGPDVVQAQLMILLKVLTTCCQEANVYVLSVKYSPQHRDNWDAIARANSKIKAGVKSIAIARVTYVDIAKTLSNHLATGNTPFQEDGVHLNSFGYELVASALYSSLSQARGVN